MSNELGFQADTDSIGQIPAFKNLNSSQLAELTSYVREVEYSSGEVVFEEHEPGRFMGFVVSGDLEILKESMTGRQSGLAVLSSGEAFGEVALVDEKPRSATVRAQSPTKILMLTTDDLARLTEAHPEIVVEIMREIARVTAQRLRRASNRLADLI